jgi:hypothetical protein
MDPAALNDHLNNLNQVSSVTSDVLDKTEKTNDAVREGLKDLDATVKSRENEGKKMKHLLNLQEQLNSFAKKLLDKDVSKLKNADKANKTMKDLVDMYKAAMASAKTTSAEAAELGKRLHLAEEFWAKMTKHGELTNKEMEEMSKHFENAAKNVKYLVTAMANLTKTGAAIKGASGILSSLGIGKGFATRMERRLEQAQEIKAAVAASKDMRAKATKKHMEEKRERSIKDIESLGNAAHLDPETGKIDLKKEDARKLLSRKMGFRSKAGEALPGAEAFEAGEEAMAKIDLKKEDARKLLSRKMGFRSKAGEALPGAEAFEAGEAGEEAMATGGEVGAAYGGVMEAGGGAIATAMGALEDGVLTAVTALEGIMLPLELVVGAIWALYEIFNSYVKQNKDMEAKLGKGGIFTAGFQDPFNQARQALNQGLLGGGGVALGATFQRNLELAGAMAQGGFGISGAMAPGAPMSANMMPGAQGEFMGGGLGLAQRTVFGAARVAGLTDTEGADQLIKLLEQYGETLTSSEQFFNKLNKDTQAAGISTTKYLKVIDEVSSHFDRMNKSLEQTTNMMRELSRYGAISSESLKDMMEFLLKGEKVSPDNIATKIFAATDENKDLLAATRKAMANTVLDTSDQIADSISKSQLTGKVPSSAPEIKAAMAAGDYSAALVAAQKGKIGLAGLRGKDATVAAPLMDQYDKLIAQIQQLSGQMEATPGLRESAKLRFGASPIQATEESIRNIDKVLKLSHVSMGDLLYPKPGKVGMSQNIMMGQLMPMLGTKSLKETQDALNQLTSRAMTTRMQDIEQAAPGTADRRQNIKEMVKALYMSKDKGGIPMFLSQKGKGTFEDLNKMSEDQLSDLLDATVKEGDLSKLNVKELQAANDWGLSLVKHAGDSSKVGDEQLAATLSVAKTDIAEKTQTIGDILTNVFKPWFTELLTGVGKIVDAVQWLSGGSDTEDLKKDFAETSGQIDDSVKAVKDRIQESGAHLQDIANQIAKLPPGSDEQKKALQEQGKTLEEGLKNDHELLAKLTDTKGQGMYRSSDQEEATSKLIEAATGKGLAAGGMPQNDLQKWEQKKLDIAADYWGNLASRAGAETKSAATTVWNIFTTDASTIVPPPGSTGAAPSEHGSSPAQK